MTTYQKHWNAEIETLLIELNAPKALEENIVDTLQNAKTYRYFSESNNQCTSSRFVNQRGSSKYGFCSFNAKW